MMKTPVDYWRNGMEIWFRTAGAQVNMTLKMMSMMPGWDKPTIAARGLAGDPVTPRGVVKTRAQKPKPAPKPALRSVSPDLSTAVEPVIAPASAPVVAKTPEPAQPVASKKTVTAKQVTEKPVPAKAAPSEPGLPLEMPAPKPAKAARKPRSVKSAAVTAPKVPAAVADAPAAAIVKAVDLPSAKAETVPVASAADVATKVDTAKADTAASVIAGAQSPAVKPESKRVAAKIVDQAPVKNDVQAAVKARTKPTGARRGRPPGSVNRPKATSDKI